MKAPRLRKGETVGLICPASAPLKPGIIEGSVAYFENRGYRVRLGANARKKHGYLAGTDEERADDFNAMVSDPDVRAILAIRGGYGTPRILPLLDYTGLRRDPKIVSGFSDITAVNCAVWVNTGLVTFSGAMPGVEFWKGAHPDTEEIFWKVVGSPKRLGKVKNPGGVMLAERRRGKAAGPLVCGNLSLLVSLLGTPYMPDLRGAVLLIEDVGEEPYRLDRMLTQLRNTGIGEEIAGLVFGTFTHCAPTDTKKPSLKLEQVLDDFAEQIPAPVMSGLQYGHIPRKLTLPMGIPAEMDTRKGTLTLLEGAVE